VKLDAVNAFIYKRTETEKDLACMMEIMTRFFVTLHIRLFNFRWLLLEVPLLTVWGRINTWIVGGAKAMYSTCIRYVLTCTIRCLSFSLVFSIFSQKTHKKSFQQSFSLWNHSQVQPLGFILAE
jgi:hypothetical protein